MVRPRIAVVGSCNVDLTTFTERVPNPGETMFGQRFDIGFGGKGANQAVAARLCGAEVSMVGRVGNDVFGPGTLANFEALGVDTRHVRVLDGVSSGVAPIFVEPSGQNRIVVVSGANDCMSPADVDEAAATLREAHCIVLQFEIPLETNYHAIAFARAHGIRCVLNPAPGRAVDFARLDGVDYVVPNESEAELISGRPVRTVDDARACAAQLLTLGARRVIVTLGANGALLAGPDVMTHVPAFEVVPLDTTGAGDAFIGSFATFLAEGVDEREAVRRANLYAALSTLGVGTQKSFVARDAFERAWRARG